MDSTETARYGSVEEASEMARSIAEARLEPYRYTHSLGTAETAAALCLRYGLDAGSGYLAGVAHDICKAMPLGEQLSLARAYIGPLPETVFENPKLPHGPAAAAFLSREGLSTDEAVLEAVAYHTVGRPGMGPLALVVYVADKIEPSRRHWAAGLRSAISEGRFDGSGGLLRLAIATIETLLGELTASGRTVAATTLVLYNSLSGKSIRAWPVL